MHIIRLLILNDNWLDIYSKSYTLAVFEPTIKYLIILESIKVFGICSWLSHVRKYDDHYDILFENKSLKCSKFINFEIHGIVGTYMLPWSTSYIIPVVLGTDGFRSIYTIDQASLHKINHSEKFHRERSAEWNSQTKFSALSAEKL